MIKINLAQQTSKAQSVSFATTPGGEVLFNADEVRKEGFKKLLILAVIPVGLWLYQQQNIPTKEQDLSNKNQTLSALQEFNSKQAESVAEIEKFKNDESQLQKRIAALDKISKDRLKIIRILDLFQQVIPEKVWLTKVDIKDTKILINGYAMTDIDNSTFMDALTKSVFLVDVNLISSNEVVVDGFTLKKFEISAWMEKNKEVVTQ
ncbi:MAG: PilN domain-containing protein [Pseudobdellovibrionaceae bacterium]